MNLNHSISVELRGQAQDDTGQRRETWQQGERVFASIRPLTGRELNSTSGRHAEVTHAIILRAGPRVAPRDRITYAGRVFDIVSVLNVEERGRYLKLMTTENVDIGI